MSSVDRHAIESVYYGNDAEGARFCIAFTEEDRNARFKEVALWSGLSGTHPDE